MTQTKLRTRDLTYCATFASLIAACSWLSIPYSVPFTMQTFAVFLTLLVLGGKLGTYSIVTYLLLGAVGAPVFSGFTGGISSLVGSTGGYLLGFLAQGVLYLLFIKKPLEKPYFDVLNLVLGLGICYLLGTIQFVLVYSRNVAEIGFMAALSMCVIPYILPDLGKMALAFVVAKTIRPLIK